MRADDVYVLDCPLLSPKIEKRAVQALFDLVVERPHTSGCAYFSRQLRILDHDCAIEWLSDWASRAENNILSNLRDALQYLYILDIRQPAEQGRDNLLKHKFVFELGQ